jgi:hypothetical protein
MRQVLCLVLFCAFATAASGAEKTLLQGGLQSGGFGGPVLKYTQVKNQDALLVGGHGGWIINHRVVLGGGGYGLATQVDAPPGVLPVEAPLDISFGYGGFEMHYILHSDAVVHATFSTLVGGGGVVYVRHGEMYSDHHHDQVGDSDAVFVLEPAIGGELNVTKWFRLAAAGSYRMVTDVEQQALDNADLSGFAATLDFKFGKF